MKQLLLIALLTGISLPRVLAQQPSGLGTNICTVTHIDFMPNHTDAASALEAYVAREKHDIDLREVHLLQSLDHPNHFTLLETFRDGSAYDHHVESQYTRAFRALIAPTLGSPYDERLFRPYPVP